MSESKLELRQVDTDQQAVVLPKNYDVRLYFEQDRTHNGYVCGKPKDLHALADWIKANVPLSLADTRDRNEDMRRLASEFFIHVDCDMDGSFLQKIGYGRICNTIGLEVGMDSVDEYITDLVRDFIPWLKERFGEAP